MSSSLSRFQCRSPPSNRLHLPARIRRAARRAGDGKDESVAHLGARRAMRGDPAVRQGKAGNRAHLGRPRAMRSSALLLGPSYLGTVGARIGLCAGAPLLGGRTQRAAGVVSCGAETVGAAAAMAVAAKARLHVWCVYRAKSLAGSIEQWASHATKVDSRALAGKGAQSSRVDGVTASPMPAPGARSNPLSGTPRSRRTATPGARPLPRAHGGASVAL